ncbi:MAG TPA: Bax inhibitor-1/YccA family protein [Natronosporangium sp.]
MRTTNPLLTRLAADAERERAMSAQAQAVPYPTTADPSSAAPPQVRAMTVDDVVVRTIGLLALVVLSAGAVWTLVPVENALAVAFPAAMVGLVLGLVISFMRLANPLLIGLYAVVEGAFVGGVSHAFNELFDGIVLQAVAATLGVFLLMAFLYKSGTIRATPKFVRFMVGALFGAAAVIVINLVITLITGEATPLRDGGPLAILVSLVFIVLAALSFILSFHEVEEGVKHGLPERYAWTCAFGIVVSLIWLYIEVLRLLSYFASE